MAAGTVKGPCGETGPLIWLTPKGRLKELEFLDEATAKCMRAQILDNMDARAITLVWTNEEIRMTPKEWLEVEFTW